MYIDQKTKRQKIVFGISLETMYESNELLLIIIEVTYQPDYVKSIMTITVCKFIHKLIIKIDFMC